VATNQLPFGTSHQLAVDMVGLDHMTRVEKTLVNGERRCADCGVELTRWQVALCTSCVRKRRRIYDESKHQDDLKVKK
jgi:hypothetical protein